MPHIRERRRHIGKSEHGFIAGLSENRIRRMRKPKPPEKWYDVGLDTYRIRDRRKGINLGIVYRKHRAGGKQFAFGKQKYLIQKAGKEFKIWEIKGQFKYRLVNQTNPLHGKIINAWQNRKKKKQV
ncbi:MAG TPA: hypothetical protein VFF13_00535 [archaeon]|nr:hypothetical protein [archaeon]